MKGYITNVALQPGAELASVNIQIDQGEGRPASTLTLMVPREELDTYKLGVSYDIALTPVSDGPAKTAAPQAAQ